MRSRSRPAASRMTARLTLAAAAIALAALPGLAGAEIRRLEAVGVAPIAKGERGSARREAAIQGALREAVFRVAEELLLEEDVGEAGASLGSVLGTDMVLYAARFRILEDRGERPVLFTEDPNVTREYVVTVEVHVDTDLVADKLADAGLLARTQPGSGHTTSVRVEVEGLTRFAAFAEVRELLMTGGRARRVVPLEFERGRAVFEVETEGNAGALLDRVLEAAPARVEIVPLEARGGELRVLVRWTPPPPGPDAEREGGLGRPAGL